MDERLTAYLADAIEAAGFPPKRMHSGAGHDAMVMASRMPTAMLFLRSPGASATTRQRPYAPKMWKLRWK